MMFAFIPIALAVVYLYIPVYFNLRLNSAFEYLTIRFSKNTSVFVSCLSIIYLIVFTSIMVFGPSLALQQVTGIDLRITTAAIFAVGMFYSAVGGLKAVVWNDAFQVGVMFVSLITIIIKGSMDEGGMSVVWQRAESGSRIQFFNIDPDPRTRHTLWTAILGGYFYWLPMYVVTQQRIQRYLSMPNLKVVRK
ncbi:unnamed protein product [Allacma fusca]|uniref:Uncharacterized protein n=1 Tax=Allacma fusca TaxID=39272 RepID=A0A8J2KJ07_9HEXA|nr:unnamed protein product [Allacma fusca]